MLLEDHAELMSECLKTAGVTGKDIAYFIPALFTQPIRPGLPGCNWKILRMN